VDDIVALAERLGKAIAASPQAAKLNAARKALEAEAETAQLLKDYNAQARKIAQLEDQQKPVEVQDKHKLEELHNRLAASQTFKSFTIAQVEYVDLMRKVNQAISRNIGEADRTRQPPAPA
jgi:cell fate (sporulation/competence/biofilm development) regulator YlbF (YheA/YmcA/DUF963 family)